jgi:hypothetical protein
LQVRSAVSKSVKKKLEISFLCRWDKSGNLMEVLLPLKEEEYSDEDLEGKERDGLEEDTGVTGR